MSSIENRWSRVVSGSDLEGILDGGSVAPAEEDGSDAAQLQA